MYAEVVFPLPFRNAFTYSVPEEFEDKAVIGSRALVPFGKRTLTGFITGIKDTAGEQEKIKDIYDILDETPVFTPESLRFYKWLSDYYLSSLGEALRNSAPYGVEIESKKMIYADPDICAKALENEKNKASIKAKILQALCGKKEISLGALQKEIKKKNIYSPLKSLEKEGIITIQDALQKARVRAKMVKFVKLTMPVEDVYDFIPEIEKKSPKQTKLILELINRKGEEVQLSEILEKTQASASSAKGLEEKNIISIFDKEIERNYVEAYKEKQREFSLTEEQQNVVDIISGDIEKKEFKPTLLYGVTGSGKTQVYIELIKKVLEQGKSAVYLVPEISLTPQVTARLFNNFGGIVAVLHSRMSLGERYDAWRGVISGKYKIVIGPRSALFAPVKDIGIIIIDEEHDGSYKQFENVPRYHARDAAVMLGKFSECPVILGSATPSIETMYNAKSEKYRLLELTKRIDGAKMPKIELVNISIERKRSKMENIFSRTLLDHIKDRIEKKQGVIILQNRRGFATQVFCDDCNEFESCPNCSVGLVYHIHSATLQCHYCGFSRKAPPACTHCGSVNLKYYGTGTQRVEDELEYYFPNAKIERVDSDSIGRKGELGMILNRFAKGEIDVLIGTQMVSKGLDFSNVTLVGVISAEATLWLPDFRADERTFQLLTQVAGRAGRSAVEGEVLIQTQNPDNFTLQQALQTNYAAFYEKTVFDRQRFAYPPFARLCLIETKDEDEKKAAGAITDFHKELVKNGAGLIISPPNPAVLAKLKGQYRFHIMVKSPRAVDPSGSLLRNAVLNAFIVFNRDSRSRDVRTIIDIDPQSVI